MHGSPICSHGRIYVPTTGALYCLFDSSKQQSADPIPEPPAEDPVASDEKPAHLQIIPAELLIKPGESQQFSGRLFNSRGQFLRNVSPEFELDGPGRNEQ